MHLVRPLGFSVDEKHLKRAGLDYWNDVDIRYYDSFDEVRALNPDSRFYLASTHASTCYTRMRYSPGDFLVFGKETAGLGEKILSRHPEDAIRIPMREHKRSLNLSNSVAIVVYEVLRQNGFACLI